MTPSGLALRLDRHRLVELEGAARPPPPCARRRGSLRAPRPARAAPPRSPRRPSRMSCPRAAGPRRRRPCSRRCAARGSSPKSSLEPPLHRERRVERTLRVILLCRGRTEGCHDRVADELLDRPAGVVDLGRHRVVEAVEEGARALRVLRVRELGRADEVGEENGRELPLLARLDGSRERVRTAGTEPSALQERLGRSSGRTPCFEV